MTEPQTKNPSASRWLILAACSVAMLAIANLQYAWTLFTTDLTRSLHASLDAVQWAFTFFVIAQTMLFPLTGYLVDRFGPKVMVCGSGVDGLAPELLTRWRRYIWLTRSAELEQEAFTAHASGSRLNGFRIGAACASVWLPARTDLALR